ncbi:hypothetical protein [Desulfuromonas sp. DDH964]|nr:hypothetical protein [Desulfuromonas sp. DDH964]
MTRILILLVGLAWASLLLISWGGSSEAQLHPDPAVGVTRAAS